MSHDERIAATAGAFESAMARFLARIEATPDAVAERVPADGGWSAAGIAWHVAVTNEQFAGLVDGTVPGSRRLPTSIRLPASREPKRWRGPARLATGCCRRYARSRNRAGSGR